MELIFKKRYEKLSDKEIVVLITDEKKHDEEAATYLLWDRYSPLLHKLFLDIIKEVCSSILEEKMVNGTS